MNLAEASQHKGIRWGALIALMVGLTQFNTGLKLVYSKWNADVAAEEAKAVAVDAKVKAEGVDDRFDQYIQEQRQAIETQNKIAEAIQGYAAQQQIPNQAYQAPERVWIETDKQGTWCCTTTNYARCAAEQLWERCR